ncbi:DUF3100 domain-containing protein [Clostridium thailandense]|uniref:DUF3100 domain-containing protein n=1 Tax=Clostridium thailandense TaxID=2794346 RepID=UPI003989B115
MNKEKLINPKVHLLALCLVVFTEFIGAKKLNVGFGVIALFPMLYALVLGGIISFPSLKLLKEKDMSKSANILGVSFVLLVAKLGTMLGPSIMKVFSEGWALLFQEVGHFIGTVILALPVAVFLGMKREAIGATYSISRENNLAIISEKFGIESQESKGAIGVYVCGTLFGAIYLGLLAGILGGTGVFHPLALAMGAGVGSGSMMAAAAGALVVLFPDFKNDILVFSGAANLATTLLGTFVCAFISLPLTERFYNWLEPRIGRRKKLNSNIERSNSNEG